MDLAVLNSTALRARRHVNLYLHAHDVRVELAGKVQRYVASVVADEDNQKEWLIEQEVLSFLPERIQKSLISETRSPIVAKHPLFLQLIKRFAPMAQDVFLKAMSLRLAHRNDVLFDKGDVCHQMLFAVVGMLKYFHKGVSKSRIYVESEDTIDD